METPEQSVECDRTQSLKDAALSADRRLARLQEKYPHASPEQTQQLQSIADEFDASRGHGIETAARRRLGPSDGQQAADQVIQRTAARTNTLTVSMAPATDRAAKEASAANTAIREVQRGDLGKIETPALTPARPKDGSYSTPETAVRQRLPEILQQGDHITTRPGLQGETEHIIAQPILINGQRQIATTVVRVRADGRAAAEASLTKVYSEADFATFLKGNENGQVMSDHLVSLDSPAEAYGGHEQRTALLNLINRATSQGEANGLINAQRLMHQQGAELVNVSLHYGSNHGLDMIYRFTDGTAALVHSYAAVDAKSGHSRDRKRLLGNDKDLDRQGSPKFNLKSLGKYLRKGDGAHNELAAELEALAEAGELHSYAAFATDGSLWRLEPENANESSFNAVKITN